MLCYDVFEEGGVPFVRMVRPGRAAEPLMRETDLADPALAGTHEAHVDAAWLSRRVGYVARCVENGLLLVYFCLERGVYGVIHLPLAGVLPSIFIHAPTQQLFALRRVDTGLGAHTEALVAAIDLRAGIESLRLTSDPVRLLRSPTVRRADALLEGDARFSDDIMGRIALTHCVRGMSVLACSIDAFTRSASDWDLA